MQRALVLAAQTRWGGIKKEKQAAKGVPPDKASAAPALKVVAAAHRHPAWGGDLMKSGEKHTTRLAFVRAGLRGRQPASGSPAVHISSHSTVHTQQLD
jgi:hypothetical protein